MRGVAVVLTLFGDVECVLSAGSGRLHHEEHVLLDQRDVGALLHLYTQGPVVFHQTRRQLQKVLSVVAGSGFHRVHDQDVLVARHVDLQDEKFQIRLITAHGF